MQAKSSCRRGDASDRPPPQQSARRGSTTTLNSSRAMPALSSRRSSKPLNSSRTLAPALASNRGAAPASARHLKKRAPSKKHEAITEEDGEIDWASMGGGWTSDKWLESLRLHTLVTSALNIPDEGAYEHAKRLTRDEISSRLRGAGLLEAVIGLVASGVEALQGQVAATGSDLNVKFHLDGQGGHELAFGSLELFYGGLEAMIGPPQMLSGSLQAKMEYEHQKGADCAATFMSSNGMTTTAEVEWEFVAMPDATKTYPERKDYRNALGQEVLPERCRRVRTLDELTSDMAMSNERLVAKGHVELLVVEAIAGRLYTGPMYEKYNAVLRKESRVPLLVQRCEQLCKGNTYSTTIHAINSCVIKLSKLTQAVKVWRGVKGATLPKQFFAPNAEGVRGGIEFGFSSTTTDRAQAVSYAQGDASTIFEMQMGMIDRGADLAWLSQYPHEREVLLPPLTGMEALTTEVDGGTLVVVTRLSLNLQALTLEQVVSRRRKMLMDMAQHMAQEIRYALTDEPERADTGARLLGKALEYEVLERPPDHFNDDYRFKDAIGKALEVKTAVVESIDRLPLQSEQVRMASWAERTGWWRPLLLAGWLRCQPIAVNIDFRYMQLSSADAEALASNLHRCPKLVSINVTKNDTMGVEGAMAFAQAQAKLPSLRSLCGVTHTNATLEVPRGLMSVVDAAIFAAELDNSAWAETVAAEQGASRRGQAARLMRRSGMMAGSWSSIIFAAKEGNDALVEALLRRQKDVNALETDKHDAGFTPLMWASYRGHFATVELLLSRGADPTFVNKDGKSAASVAQSKGFATVSTYLEVCTSRLQKAQLLYIGPGSALGDAERRVALLQDLTAKFKLAALNAAALNAATNAPATAPSGAHGGANNGPSPRCGQPMGSGRRPSNPSARGGGRSASLQPATRAAMVVQRLVRQRSTSRKSLLQLELRQKMSHAPAEAARESGDAGTNAATTESDQATAASSSTIEAAPAPAPLTEAAEPPPLRARKNS